jgi:hypothetical protein
MHRLVSLGLAAALLVGASTTALAESKTTNSSASMSTSVATDPMTTGSIGDDFNVLMNRVSGVIAADLAGLSATSKVEFVAIDTLQGWDATKFDAAIGKKVADFDEWRDRLELNSVLKSKLEAAGHSIDDVIAIEQEGDTFKVYIDDRA